MFNKLLLKIMLANYKKDFPVYWWDNEKYKWEAIKCFQDNWDINADSFASMLHSSLDKTSNLLASNNNFPRKMIEKFATKTPEEVRAMFSKLFDESRDVYDRIKDFKDQSNIMLKKYGNGVAHHYQHENAITTYLWLRYPDKYYIYKYGVIKTAANELGSDYRFKKGDYADNIRNFFKFYNEISEELKHDTELVDLFKSRLTDTCYPDPELKTLTIDVGFYISKFYAKKGSQKIAQDEFFPPVYDPGLTSDDWYELLSDGTVFTTGSLEVMKRMKDHGGKATCSQLALKYGETKDFYNWESMVLGKRVAKITDCPIMECDNENLKWWSVLYVIKDTMKDEEDSYIWKLRGELAEALNKIDLSRIQLYSNSEQSENRRHYWWLNANPKLWKLSDLDVGEIRYYTLYNENGHKRMKFKNFLDAKAGDLVIGYESYPIQKIIALVKVSEEQDGENLYFEKTEELTSPIDYKTLKSFPQLRNMEYFANPQGSLFKLTKSEYDFIIKVIREKNPLSTEKAMESYNKDDFLKEVYMQEKRYDLLVAVLKNKKNIILKGAPGVGKTFAAQRLAYSIIGKKDKDRVEFVQFHQNYSYEDFIMGYRPVENGFKLKYGIFYRFCEKAASQPDKDYFFIIDEINRGNMSKIFGELLMLIEKDYRGAQVTLAYNGQHFTVPENLYIIGMMNTADRSLAMIDYALRRRFSFFDMEPGFDTDGFIRYQNKLNNETFNNLIEKIKDLNKTIASDKSLGRGFCIGHSYFCGRDTCSEEWLRSVVDFDILPMLSEYWFDDTAELQRWDEILHGVFK